MTALAILDDRGLGFEVEPGPAAPPWAHQPTVEWQVCGACNYDCSYCIQSRRYRVGYPTAAELDAMLDFLADLDGAWEIKMTGGEPFSSKLFLRRIIPRLLETRHTVSLLTNLSVPEKHVARFAEMTRGRLGIVSASLHFEFTDTASFLRRLEVLRAGADANARFVVNCVLAPRHLDEVARAKAEVEAAGLRFFPQLMKVKKAVHAYSPEDMRKVRAIVGDLALAERERSANLAPAYTGRRCWTGAQYFVMLQSGEVWSCRSSRREGHGYLGNAVEGTARQLAGPHACPYTICPCSVPANRGMIEGVS
jgi:organic radical activating enzyme